MVPLSLPVLHLPHKHQMHLPHHHCLKGFHPQRVFASFQIGQFLCCLSGWAYHLLVRLVAGYAPFLRSRKKKGRGGLVLANWTYVGVIFDWFLGRSCRSKLNLRSIQPKPLELWAVCIENHCMLFHSFQLSKSLHGFTTQIHSLTLWLSHVPEVSFWTWKSLRFAFTWTTKQRQTGTGCKVEVASDQPRDKPQY